MVLKSRGFELQKQAHDHVLNQQERNPHAFEDTVHYNFWFGAALNVTTQSSLYGSSGRSATFRWGAGRRGGR